VTRTLSIIRWVPHPFASLWRKDGRRIHYVPLPPVCPATSPWRGLLASWRFLARYQGPQPSFKIGRTILFMKSGFRLTSALIILSALPYGVSQTVDSTESERDKDTYAIYSMVLAHLETSHGPDDNERYLIEATTSASGLPEEPCVNPPKEREADFREVLLDYERRKATPRRLKPVFSISKPFALLSVSEAREFMKERSSTSNGNVASNPQFQGVSDLVTLSDVYFNQDRTLALAGISLWCGNLCGLYEWKVLERLATGKWQELKWVTCITVSRESESVRSPFQGHQFSDGN